MRHHIVTRELRWEDWSELNCSGRTSVGCIGHLGRSGLKDTQAGWLELMFMEPPKTGQYLTFRHLYLVLWADKSETVLLAKLSVPWKSNWWAHERTMAWFADLKSQCEDWGLTHEYLWGYPRANNSSKKRPWKKCRFQLMIEVLNSPFKHTLAICIFFITH